MNSTTSQNFVVLAVNDFNAALLRRSFVSAVRGGEVTYERTSKVCPNLKMIVYSSVDARTGLTRGKGADAVRVALVWAPPNGPQQGIDSARRVYRTGSVEGVLKRLEARLRTTAAEAAEMLKETCPHCGAPTYADSGRCRIASCRKVLPSARVVAAVDKAAQARPL